MVYVFVRRRRDDSQTCTCLWRGNLRSQVFSRVRTRWRKLILPPVRFVVPYPPGGPLDEVARAAARLLTVFGASRSLLTIAAALRRRCRCRRRNEIGARRLHHAARQLGTDHHQPQSAPRPANMIPCGTGPGHPDHRHADGARRASVAAGAVVKDRAARHQDQPRRPQLCFGGDRQPAASRDGIPAVHGAHQDESRAVRARRRPSSTSWRAGRSHVRQHRRRAAPHLGRERFAPIAISAAGARRYCPIFRVAATLPANSTSMAG